MIYHLSRVCHHWHSGQYGAALLVKALSFHWSYQALRLPRAAQRGCTKTFLHSLERQQNCLQTGYCDNITAAATHSYMVKRFMEVHAAAFSTSLTLELLDKHASVSLPSNGKSLPQVGPATPAEIQAPPELVISFHLQSKIVQGGNGGMTGIVLWAVFGWNNTHGSL